MMFSLLFVFGFSAVVAVVVIYALGLGSRPKNYPPGPPTLPIIGNLHQIPKRNEHLKFTEWAREYGPIYSIMIGSQPMIVLSDGQTVKDLLDKRGAIYSDRPEVYVAKHERTGQLRVLTMPYGQLWRTCRKVIHSLLSVTASSDYMPYQILERKQMLSEILQDPDDFYRAIHRYSISVTTTMIFGWRTPDHNDARVNRLMEQLTEALKVLTTGSSALIDAFPILRYAPDFLLPIKAQVKYAFDLGHKCNMANWNAVKQQIADKTIRPCICVGLAEAELSDEEAAHVAGNIFEGGAETTADSLYAFVQAMLLFPDVQTKAQEEIERVVGPDRVPTFDDAQNLPYIRCCVKELVRWFPAAPLGAVPHATTREDTYKGYTIPKGAAIVHNIWAIHTDPARYPEPRRFVPERFINDDLSMAESAAHPDPPKRDSFAFGAGRRICPGMHIADRSLFIGISGLLWGFNIRPKRDDLGKEILPDPDDIIVAVAAIPAPFVADIKPRGEKRAEIIGAQWEDAKALLEPGTMQWKETPEEVRVRGTKA